MATKLAVIPARGGSTRLKDKNIFPLAGKPLIRWSVEAVLESGSFNKVVVSTDSDEIFSAVADLPIERHHRPAEHATVRATALDAMINLMYSYEKYDIFSYFLPTCPLVAADDIRQGVELLSDPSYPTDFVISMTELQDTFQLACLMKDDWVLPVLDNLTAGLTNSKFIQKYHKPSGAFYMGHWDRILEHQNFFKGNVRGVVIPKERSIDINNIIDIRLAEKMIEDAWRG